MKIDDYWHHLSPPPLEIYIYDKKYGINGNPIYHIYIPELTTQYHELKRPITKAFIKNDPTWSTHPEKIKGLRQLKLPGTYSFSSYNISHYLKWVFKKIPLKIYDNREKSINLIYEDKI